MFRADNRVLTVILDRAGILCRLDRVRVRAWASYVLAAHINLNSTGMYVSTLSIRLEAELSRF